VERDREPERDGDSDVDHRVQDSAPPLLIEQHREREPRPERDLEREDDARTALGREPRDD